MSSGKVIIDSTRGFYVGMKLTFKVTYNRFQRKLLSKVLVNFVSFSRPPH